MQTKDDKILEVAKEYEALADHRLKPVKTTRIRELTRGTRHKRPMSGKRNRTQETYVRKEEQDVEKLRSHY
ncbi:hypothetical protein C1H76_7530 [Elsinoe australis]|uniref:Uncharacterized protein n=1 Tax=Elsinoe australis TaxID=40998 RepID=A0A4U7AZ35_9PEZI|nr:hypothetical protein C1H76_7530 [Elsinoe australis]